MEYGDKQFRKIDREGKGLTRDLRKEGWHFCSEYDYGLTDGEQKTDEGCCAWCGFDKRKVK